MSSLTRLLLCTQRLSITTRAPATEMSEVAEDLKAIFKVRRQKAALALAEEFVESSTASVCRRRLRSWRRA
jgi:hypothetical protein